MLWPEGAATAERYRDAEGVRNDVGADPNWLATNPPPLTQVLQLQLESCSARRDAADKAVGLIKTALATIKSGKELSLENLCNLTRSMEMEDQFSRLKIVREVINETITPDEERAVVTWVASWPPDEMKAIRESVPAVLAMRSSIQDLRQNNVDPGAPEAQVLAVRENELAVQYGLHNFAASMFEWNGPLGEKWLQTSERGAWRKKSSEPGTPRRGFGGLLPRCASRFTVASGARADCGRSRGTRGQEDATVRGTRASAGRSPTADLRRSLSRRPPGLCSLGPCDAVPVASRGRCAKACKLGILGQCDQGYRQAMRLLALTSDGFGRLRRWLTFHRVLGIVAALVLLLFFRQFLLMGMDVTFLFGLDLGLVIEVSALLIILAVRNHAATAVYVAWRGVLRFKPVSLFLRRGVRRAFRSRSTGRLLPPADDEPAPGPSL